MLTIILTLGYVSAFGQQFSYKPINPAFGGETFNYQWLLSSANAQNQFDNNKNDPYKTPSAISGFSENVNRQILDQLSRQLFGTDFNSETQLTPGSYNIGNLLINVTRSSSGLYVNIIDIVTGEQTEILLP